MRASASRSPKPYTAVGVVYCFDRGVLMVIPEAER